MKLTPLNPDWHARTSASHQAQHLMRTMGMRLLRVAPGEVDVEMPMDIRLCESGGGLHGGTISSGMDTVCASAAASLVAAEDSVLTAELKASFLRHATGDLFRFEGRVVKPGKSLIFTEGKTWAVSPDGDRLLATMTATMAVIKGGA